uniref:Uncharacterized protein LOC114325777 n=1 Tax=Diabrotica virgifera virgifera TaxID=50390 RepID=A0A6P7F7N7_DIAVI
MGLGVDMGYMRDEVSFNDIRWIFKIRCGVLYLNDRPGRADDRKKCALCNEREVEDILHFMGRCPILREYRMKWFRKSRLDREELLELMKGLGWRELVGYARDAWKYRHNLVLEYNY